MMVQGKQSSRRCSKRSMIWMEVAKQAWMFGGGGGEEKTEERLEHFSPSGGGSCLLWKRRLFGVAAAAT